jgi:hypothetical protein
VRYPCIPEGNLGLVWNANQAAGQRDSKHYLTLVDWSFSLPKLTDLHKPAWESNFGLVSSVEDKSLSQRRFFWMQELI